MDILQEIEERGWEPERWTMHQRAWDDLRADFAKSEPEAAESLPDTPRTLLGYPVVIDEDAPYVYLKARY